MKRSIWTAAVGIGALMCLSAAVSTQSREQVDRINDSIQVLHDLTAQADVRIPQYLLERAEAIVVIPDMIRGGFIVGAKHGKGILSVRDRRSDRWSPPAFIKMTGGSVGWQIGAQSVDLVLLVMNENGVRKLLDNKFTLGGDLSATAGPVGRSASAATDISLESEILTYSRAKGLFAGATFEGVSLRADDDANSDFYGSEVDLRGVTLDTPKDLRVPMIATTWTDAVRNATRRSPAPVDNRDSRAPARRDDNRDVRDVNKDLPRQPLAYGDAEPLTITLLANNPDRYYGKRVSLSAWVDSVYSPTSFSLDEDTQYSNGRRVIVINPQPSSRMDERGRVTVVGTMYKFDKGDIEKRLGGWRWDVPSDVLNSFKGHPVVIAESIRGISREMVGGGPMMTPPAASFTTPPPGFSGKLVAINEIAGHAKSYYNREVMVTASVESLYSRAIFSLDDDRLMSTGRTVLVAAPTLVRPVGDNMEVSVIGKLIKFKKSDVEKRFKGYKLDVHDNIEDQLKDQPVILATSIRTRDGEELLGARVIK